MFNSGKSFGDLNDNLTLQTKGKVYIQYGKKFIDLLNDKGELNVTFPSEINKLISIKSSWATTLIANLLTVSTRKNLLLSGRSFHTSPKTIRGRVMSYLNTLSLQKGSDEFDIPFDRQQLADYLNLERTALSKELGKMQRDGLIEFKKDHFCLPSKNLF